MKERQGYSPQTVAHLRDVLSKMFGTVVLWGWLDENPTKGTTLPRMERRRVAGSHALCAGDHARASDRRTPRAEARRR